jgi:hypothetical protein
VLLSRLRYGRATVANARCGAAWLHRGCDIARFVAVVLSVSVIGADLNGGLNARSGLLSLLLLFNTRSARYYNATAVTTEPRSFH